MPVNLSVKNVPDALAERLEASLATFDARLATAAQSHLGGRRDPGPA